MFQFVVVELVLVDLFQMLAGSIQIALAMCPKGSLESRGGSFVGRRGFGVGFGESLRLGFGLGGSSRFFTVRPGGSSSGRQVVGHSEVAVQASDGAFGLGPRRGRGRSTTGSPSPDADRVEGGAGL